jgi:hypothetical protein
LQYKIKRDEYAAYENLKASYVTLKDQFDEKMRNARDVYT